MSDYENSPTAAKTTSAKFFIGLLVGFLIAAVIALAVGLGVGLSVRNSAAAPAQDVTKLPLTPALVASNWTEILRRASGTTVNFWFWGLDPAINAFVERVYGTPLLNEFNIRLRSGLVNATLVAVQQVQSEYATGNTKNGAVDLIWINGENFQALKSAGQLWGPFAKALPLSSTVDYDNTAISLDFGQPIDGMESVWSEAQYQFVCLPSRTPVANLPRSFSDWLAYARANPGRVTYAYPSAGDFLGTRFLKQALLELAPRGFFSGSTFDQAKYDQYAPILWQKLNEIKPFLWRAGQVYPATGGDLDYLFANNTVDFTVTNDVTGAQRGIDTGSFPAGSKAFIWHTYSIGDFNYVAIPGNAANVPAALVLANLILRPDRQALQKIPAQGFGLGYGINYKSVPAAERTVLDLADQLLGNSSVDSLELAQYLIGDVNPQYHNAVVAGWLANVGKDTTTYSKA
jgi:putative spermidine/putrescine transport system substrate-binding protein